MGHREHRHLAPRRVRVAVLTISDTRSEKNDYSGRLIRKRLEEAGHEVGEYRIVPDDPARIRKVVRGWSRGRRVEEMILTERLDGFGEIFRLLSYRQVGSAAFLSRALAGLCGDKVLFSLPGSAKAVELAMDRLILPELGHLIQQLRKKE